MAKTTSKPTTKTPPAQDEPVRVALLRADVDAAPAARATAIQRVTDAASRLVATEHVAGLRALKRRIEEHYAAIKKPLNEALAKIREMEREDLRPVLAADAHLQALVLSYDREERERVEAENRRRREEAEARARAEREAEVAAARAAAKAATTRAAKTALASQARAIESAPLPAPSFTPAAAQTASAQGVSSTSRYKASVTNPTAVILAAAANELLVQLTLAHKATPDVVAALQTYIGDEHDSHLPLSCVQVHEPPLNALARDIGKDFRAPGVVAVESGNLTVRR